jgi:hypothetical protein
MTLEACILTVTRPTTCQMTESKMAQLDSRLQALIDRQDIQDAILRFCRGIDRLDVELIRSAFHPDGYDDHGQSRGLGWDFAEEFVARARPADEFSAHSVQNVLIELNDAATAHCESYWLCYMGRRDGERLLLAGGRYIDLFEKREAAWKIANRVVATDFSGPITIDRQATRNFLSKSFPSTRDRSDISYQRPLSTRRSA